MEINSNILNSNERAIFSLRSLYKSFGYSYYKMSKFEEYDFYAQNKDFLISQDIITFTDTNGKLMALKPDVTLSIIKNSKIEKNEIKKLYYNENVYRVQNSSNSYKEIMQTGLECIGDIDDYCIDEVLNLAVMSLKSIDNDFVLEVSDLELIGSVIALMQVSTQAKADFLTALSQKNIDFAEELINKYYIDKNTAELFKALITEYGNPKTVLKNLSKITDNALILSRINYLSSILSEQNCDKIRLDFSLVNDTAYYNGLVFKGYINKVASAVLTGGQYDPLVKRMGYSFKAIGFAVYLDLLLELNYSNSDYDYDAVVLYNDTADITALKAKVNELRQQNLNVCAKKVIDKTDKYKTLYIFKNGEVTAVEQNA